jgi:benzoyl-CoA reductase/2-hydroxyglutaryl-CoA dehydratase subunit BcrC/BadD/HgdB
LARAIDSHRVKGFVYLTLKYCEPAEFDYPFIKECLHELGIPVLYLEVDSPSTLRAQMATRLEAFAEMLKGVE